MNSSKNGILHLDARIRVILVPVFTILAFIFKDQTSLFLMTGLISTILFLSGVIKRVLIQDLLIVGFSLLQLPVGKLNLGGFQLFAMTMLQLIPIMLFFGLLGISLTNTLTTGEMIETMERLKIPRQIRIPFAVTLRYLPTIKSEMCYIRECLKIKGIDYSFTAFVRSPIRWLEYMLVPLLMRSLKLADELSAAAMVRGIEKPVKHAMLYSTNKER